MRGVESGAAAPGCAGLPLRVRRRFGVESSFVPSSEHTVGSTKTPSLLGPVHILRRLKERGFIGYPQKRKDLSSARLEFRLELRIIVFAEYYFSHCSVLAQVYPQTTSVLLRLSLHVTAVSCPGNVRVI